MHESMSFSNPFEYDAANNLPVEDLLDIFVEDYNYSRFICAPRNVFLIGERGSGKSMTLRYNSFPVRVARSKREKSEAVTDFVGVLVECNAPLYARKSDDFCDADEFKIQLISEHLFVADIGQAIVESIESASELLTEVEIDEIQDALTVFYGVELDTYGTTFYRRLSRYFQSMSILAQKALNSMKLDDDGEYITFSSAILPLLEELKRTVSFADSHFMLMIDDAQNLNQHMRRILNSWLAYRSQSLFSFKVGAAKSEYRDFYTNNGSPILEGHDFITLDMEQPFQNPNSEFSKFSKKVLEKRLKQMSTKMQSIDLMDGKSVEDFFPISEALSNELLRCRSEVEDEYIAKNPQATRKQINDWGYKYGRVKYFRDRHPKANLPSYSGFDTIAHVSTGVIRRLLEPCYYMFDAATSDSDGKPVDHIPPEIQSRVLKERSDNLWTIVSELHIHVRGCTEDDAISIFKLLESLGEYFKNRLMTHKSEPRVLAFTISSKDTISDSQSKNLIRLINICRAERLIYIRRGVSRDRMTRETYFVPDRLLWPSLGLDLIGQHGRASIPANYLYNALTGAKIPTNWNDDKSNETDFLEFNFMDD